MRWAGKLVSRNEDLRMYLGLSKMFLNDCNANVMNICKRESHIITNLKVDCFQYFLISKFELDNIDSTDSMLKSYKPALH